jgi:hypothetical protein
VSPIESSTSRTSATAESQRRILTGEEEGALARLRISAVLHPAVLIAPAIAPASSSKEIAHPRSVRIVGLRSFVVSIEIAPAGDESFGPVNRSGC